MLAKYKQISKVCNEDISLIENYNEAINDQENVWWLYHKQQIYSKLTKKELELQDLWYNRPASELIFLKLSKEEIDTWYKKRETWIENRKKLNLLRHEEKLKREELEKFNKEQIKLRKEEEKRLRREQEIFGQNRNNFSSFTYGKLNTSGKSIADYLKTNNCVLYT